MRVIFICVLCSLVFLVIPGDCAHAQNGLHFWGQLDQKHGTTSGVSYSGLWGYVAPDGREYAIVGTATGTQIIDITKQDSIREIAHVSGPTSIWREMRTWKDRAYVVSEGGSGVQIINLANLPVSANLIRSFNYTSGTKNIIRNHTIEIFDGFMYLNGSANWSPGGVLIFSLANPDTPAFVGEYQQEYAHDSYIRGNRLYAAAINSGGLNIADITNRSAPSHAGKITYTGAGTHNAWTTTDGNYVFTTDEIGGTPKTLKVWFVASIPPVPTSTSAQYAITPNDIVHNVTVRGKYAYVAWYTAGTVVVDVRVPNNPTTAGHYDSSVEPPGSYDGVWAVYPYFWSGKIIGGDMQNGLYIFTFDSLKARTPAVLLSPPDGTPVCDAPSVNFQWSRVANPVDDPHTYTLTILGPGYDSTFQVGSDTSYSFTNSLPDGLYTWYVTTIDEATRIATRDTFSFQKTTRALGLTTPDGGNTLKAGAEAVIEWNESCIDSLFLEYSTNAGASWQHIGTVPAVPPSFIWTVPHEVTTQGLVRISAIGDPGLSDTSSSTFEIFESLSLLLLSPSQGEVWLAGSTRTIAWSHQVVTDLAIDYSTDNGFSWFNVVTDTPASIGSFDWHVPRTGSPDARVRIRSVTDSTVASVSDRFNLPLTVLGLHGGWNLASFPAHPPDQTTLANFARALTPSIYYFNGYQAEDSIRNGRGFWIKYGSPDSEYVYGVPVERETVAVSERWNVLGSLLDPVPAASIVTNPPSLDLAGFFGFDPLNGFEVADTLFPGKGYWVKSSSGGEVILSSTASAMTTGKSVRQSLDGLDRLIVSDATGKRQRLYAGSLQGGVAEHSLAGLPPALEGMFDARFVSESLIAPNVGHGDGAELRISSAVYPVTITLERASRPYEVVERLSSKPDIVHMLEEGGTVNLGTASGRGVILRPASAEPAVPVSFMLHQNYPNPFNPTTAIRYEIPSASDGTSYVTLTIYNTIGQVIASLVNGIQDAGSKTITFDAGDLPDGTYFCRLTAGGQSMMRKMIFMK